MPEAPDSPVLDLRAIQALVAGDMAAVDALIRSRLASDVVLINQVAGHIVGAGGKRLRPMLLLLSARAFGTVGAEAHQLAAVIEFIHTATLLHDDVVDASSLRRGRATANALFGNAASVLVGDFLYSRSFQLMVELERVEVMRILADTTNAIAEGEVLQLLHVHNPDTDEAAYLAVIERKTAVLFAAAAQLGALCGNADPAMQERLRSYGLALGSAFQIADDVLDYHGDEAATGKHLGDDLAEGKATLGATRASAPPLRCQVWQPSSGRCCPRSSAAWPTRRLRGRSPTCMTFRRSTRHWRPPRPASGVCPGAHLAPRVSAA